MAFVYIKREDLSLTRNKYLIDVLDYNNISESTYSLELLPFLDEISGQLYHSRDLPLKNSFGFPQLLFHFNKLSLIELRDFLRNPGGNDLNIPIQDRNSMLIESTRYFAPPGISEGPGYVVKNKAYKKQKGHLHLTLEKTGEIIPKLSLDRIIDESCFVGIETSKNFNRRSVSILMG